MDIDAPRLERDPRAVCIVYVNDPASGDDFAIYRVGEKYTREGLYINNWTHWMARVVNDEVITVQGIVGINHAFSVLKRMMGI